MRQKFIEWLNSEGYPNACDDMYKYIMRWKSWFKGKIDSFHKYQIWNGDKWISCEKKTMQLPKIMCQELAKLLFNEKCLISIDGSDISSNLKDDSELNETARYVKKQLDDINFWQKINEMQEWKGAVGTTCYIPYAKNVKLDENGRSIEASAISMNYVTADKIIPLSWENGIIKEIAVMSERSQDGVRFLFAQLFVLGSDYNYITRNHLFSIGKEGHNFQEVPLTTLDEFKNLPAVVFTDSSTKPFIIDKMNLVNNIVDDSPFGIALFANAVDAIMASDNAFDSMDNEIALGRLRLIVKEQAIDIDPDGKKSFDPNNPVFQIVKGGAPVDPDGNPYINVINPDLRILAHKEGIQMFLNVVSFQSGFGDNFFRFDGGSVYANIPQVISEKNPLYQTLARNEIVLDAVITDLVKLIIEIGIIDLRIPGLNPDAQIRIQFDDSIIEDTNTMKSQYMQEVSAGIRPKYTYNQKFYGEDETIAKRMITEARDEAQSVRPYSIEDFPEE